MDFLAGGELRERGGRYVCHYRGRGRRRWGRGFATEAAKAVVQYGFDRLVLHRIYAEHFTRNASSGRVLQKIGMRHEGTMRQAHKKWGEYLDTELYAILRSDLRELSRLRRP